MAEDKFRRNGVDEEDEDEILDEAGFKDVKDAVIFAIHVSNSMIARPEPTEDKKTDRDSATSAALKCAYHLMQQRIISNPNDMMGILLFGTEQSKFQDEDDSRSSGHAYPHCYLLTDLDVPEAADVKRLRDLVEGDEAAQKILIPSTEPVSMANVLFCANQVFTTKAPNFSSRRLFIVTDDPAPHAKDKALASAAAVRAKDLYDLGVMIELFPIAQKGREFDRAIFYDDIVYQPPTSDPEAPLPILTATKAATGDDGISLLQSLLSSINSRAVPRRALFNLPLEIGPGLKISVKGYILVKRQEVSQSCYVWLDGEKPQIAVGISAKTAEDTSQAVEKGEIRKAYKFGGETVSFTKEEAAAIRTFGDPVIRILGFKKSSALPMWANTKGSTFIYPSETDYIGSSRVFSALQQKLIRSHKMALAWFIARRNATPVIAAVLPAVERFTEDGTQSMPPGLWLVPLPYADDIRSNPEYHVTPAPDSLVDKMRVIVQQLQLPKGRYDPSRYPNPGLQWFYRILQALALDEETPEKADDKTVPRYKQIHKRAGPFVVEWGNELEARYAEWESGKVFQRGPGVGSGGFADRTKPAKTSNGAADEVHLRKLYEKGELSKSTLPVLKEFAQAKNISVSGKKADLVDRLEQYFEKAS